MKENNVALAWIWVGLNYSVLGINMLLVNHLSSVADSLGACTDDTPSIAPNKFPSHSDPKVDRCLPSWCSIELDEKDEKKGRNRQQKLYLCQEDTYMTILQTNVVFSSIYWAMLFLSYFPYMYNHQKFVQFCLYVVVAFIPSQFTNKQWISILALQTEVLSVGHLRRPRVIAAVVRDQKIESMIRSFLMIQRVDKFVNSFDMSCDTRSCQLSKIDDLDVSLKSTGSMAMRKRVKNAFDAMDQNGDGHLDETEFESLLEGLGMPVTHQMGHKIVSALDVDGDGVIDVEELEIFYKAIMTDGSCPHDMAKDLFSMFDKDGHGHITPNEFARVLDGLNLGFNIDDIGQILQEVDEDGDGKITFHEFQRVIEEYMPSELLGGGTDPPVEVLSVHPLLTVIEGIGSTVRSFFSYENPHENQHEADPFGSERVFNDLMIQQHNVSYGSLSSQDVSSESFH